MQPPAAGIPALRQAIASYVGRTRETYVADKLRQAILSGYLRPGQKLDQNEIAELLRVSRSPVREALRTLAAEGLLTDKMADSVLEVLEEHGVRSERIGVDKLRPVGAGGLPGARPERRQRLAGHVGGPGPARGAALEPGQP